MTVFKHGGCLVILDQSRLFDNRCPLFDLYSSFEHRWNFLPLLYSDFNLRDSGRRCSNLSSYFFTQFRPMITFYDTRLPALEREKGKAEVELFSRFN